jgi:hypothetical protein
MIDHRRGKFHVVNPIHFFYIHFDEQKERKKNIKKSSIIPSFYTHELPYLFLVSTLLYVVNVRIFLRSPMSAGACGRVQYTLTPISIAIFLSNHSKT